MLKKTPVVCVLGILRVFAIFPLSFNIILGSFIGKLAYFLVRGRRRVGEINLGLCFPNLSQEERNKLLKQHFEELIISGLCYGWIFYASPKKLRNNVTLHGLENFDKFRNKDPIILLAPHLLGLDIGANRFSLETAGYSMYSHQRNEYMNLRLKEARSRFMKDSEGEIFSRQEGIRSIVKKMKATKLPFYYLPDQDMDEKSSLYVPFFAHQYCATLDTLPKLVTLTGAKVIPMATYREGNSFVVEFFPAMENYPSGDVYNDVANMNKEIEKLILKHPSQYLWMHKRFKTQPNMQRGALYNKF